MAETTNSTTDPIEVNLTKENPSFSIESACMQCGSERGRTTFLYTEIPFFHEIIVSNFVCPDCGWKNNSVQNAGAIQLTGVDITLTATCKKDCDRSIVKSTTCTIKLPQLDFEIPPETQGGTLNTIEGILSRASEGLASLLVRPDIDAASRERIATVVAKLRAYAAAEEPFTFQLNDPSGNSYIENPFAPEADPNMTVLRFRRNKQQDEMLGVVPEDKTDQTEQAISNREFTRAGSSKVSILQTPEAIAALEKSISTTDDNLKEVFEFPGRCIMCHEPGVQRMLCITIPYFKDCIIMSYNCNACGYKDNEVKSAGAISKRGKRVTLRVTKPVDLARDVLKSETAAIHIPEIDLRVAPGAHGGKFTTVEGLIASVSNNLANSPFITGDSAQKDQKDKFHSFIDKLRRFQKLESPWTLVMHDPMANSYVQNIKYPEKDEALEVMEYERTQQENDELGISDMNTENYMEPETKANKDQDTDKK